MGRLLSRQVTAGVLPSSSVAFAGNSALAGPLLRLCDAVTATGRLLWKAGKIAPACGYGSTRYAALH